MALTLRPSALVLLCGLLGVGAPAQTASPADTTSAVQPLSRWSRLSASERAALAPLAEQWGQISETQRSKWLTIARNFDQLSPAEQQVMQARMKEWVKLSPVQRNQARLNFNTVQSVSKDQRKTRWDEYQALSEDEKRKLSVGVPAAAKTAAPSPRPTSSDRLVQPTVRTVPASALPPRTPIDKHTLLPVPTPVSHPQEAPASDSATAKEASPS